MTDTDKILWSGDDKVIAAEDAIPKKDNVSVTDDDCAVCGVCWWVQCDNDADYEDDVDLKRHGLLVYSGKVDLCAGHHRFAAMSGSMNLKWAAVEQALARQHA